MNFLFDVPLSPVLRTLRTGAAVCAGCNESKVCRLSFRQLFMTISGSFGGSAGSGPAGDYHYLVTVLPLPEKQDETSGIRPCNVFGQFQRKSKTAGKAQV